MSEPSRAPVGSEQLDGIAWNAWFTARIADAALCPVCMRPEVFEGVCAHCSADLRGEAGAEIWRASQDAAEALSRREDLLRAALATGPAASVASAAAAVEAHDRFSSAPRSDATLQSMFALAGAGLVAVAAIVFTFFNTDLENRVVRSGIVGVITLLFLGAAWWLAKRGARLSAEAVGGLGAVFVAIDIWALAQSASGASSAWLMSAAVTLLCALGALRLGAVVGLRTWTFAAMLGLAAVPAMLGYACAAASPAVGAPWLVLGHLGVVLAIVALFEWMPRLRALPEPGSPTAAGEAERVLLSALQVGVALLSVPLLAAGLLGGSEISVGILLLGFAVAAVLAARHRARGFWSLVAGASGAAVLPALAFGSYVLGSWQLPVITAGAVSGALLVAALAPRVRSVLRPQAVYAALSVPALFALPTAVFLVVGLGSVLRSDDGIRTDWNAEVPWTFVVNGILIAAGSAAYARLARAADVRRHPSMPVLDALCTVVAALFAMLSVLLAVRALLDLGGFAGVALESLVTSFGLAVAVLVTLVPWVPVRAWATVLAVATVPFIAGVAAVVGERSGWTALTTASMFALSLTLLLTRRPGLGVQLRAVAAAMLVPSLSVLLVCLGAEALTGSASPVVLPLIAAVVATALACSRQLFARVPGASAAPRLAFEASTLLSGAIAVLLSLAREAAGLGTACIVLLLIGIGAVLLARYGDRRYGWWLAGFSLTGALWCVLGLAEAGALEAYLLPPAISASLVAMWLSRRGSRQLPLYSVGLCASIVPVLAMLVWNEDHAAARAACLLAAAWALLAVGGLLRRGWVDRALAAPTFLAAMVAGAAGSVFAIRMGAAGESFFGCLAVSAVGAGAMFGAARGLRATAPQASAARWPEIPGAVALAAGCWWAIDPNWTDIWSMWALMLAYLIAMVVVVRQQLAGRGPLIPASALFAIAFVTAIVAWSPRELRVDVFSLPLGLMLTLAGSLALLRGRRTEPGAGEGERGVSAIARWPIGMSGSWRLLGPGITVTVLASIIATFTDPQTWRAILVMVIALISMLIGARLRLAAPFVLGLIVLPVENVFVFAVQIGRGIESMPWWITLATIGAVLLSIAVVAERRESVQAGEPGVSEGLMSRMRDLR